MAGNRDAAERRVNQVRAFRAELAALRAAGASPLSPEQESALTSYHDTLLQRLAAQYDVDRSESAGRLSRGMQLLSCFGAAALTAAVYSLVARFWGQLDLPQQATLLAAFPLTMLVAVEFWARRERTLYIASLFALAAYGTCWLAIIALSRTLNIPVTPPYIWAGVLFGIALAAAYGFRIILALALAALTIAVAGSAFQAAEIPWTQAIERPELLMLTGFSLLVFTRPLAQVDPAFAPVTRLVALTIGLGALLVLSTEGGPSLLPVSSNIAAGLYQGLMLLVTTATLVLGVRRGWTDTVHLASVMLAVFLFVRYIDWFWDVLPRYAFFFVLAIMAFAWLLILRRVRLRLGAAA